MVVVAVWLVWRGDLVCGLSDMGGGGNHTIVTQRPVDCILTHPHNV